MALIGVAKAAGLVGLTRRTVYRDITSGKLSAHKDDKGVTKIDTSELIRVYGELSQQPHNKVSTASHKKGTTETPPEYVTELLNQITALREQNKQLSENVTTLTEKVDGLSTQLLALPNPATKKRWWQWK